MTKTYDFVSRGTIELTEHVEPPPVDPEEKQKIKEWSEVDLILGIGMIDAAGEDNIHILQELLNDFLDDDLVQALNVDGNYGGLTDNAARLYQAFRLLEPGRVGELTKGDMYKAFCTKWTDHDPYMLDDKVKVHGSALDPMGYIPNTYGEVYQFGGPDDCDDLYNGQAYLLKSDGDNSPKDFCEYNRDLVDLKILRVECLEMDEYPIVTCGSTSKRAQGSWCLNSKEGLYCAIDTASAFGLYGSSNPKIVIKNWRNGKIAVLLRTDKGPRPDLGAIDMAAGTMELMELQQDDPVTIGFADFDAELGIY